MNVQLVTTEKFGDLDCNFYRNMNDDILLTREQIGTALEYKNPQKAIDNIHAKHKERLDNFSVTLKTRGTDNKNYLTCLYSTKGVMEICRYSHQSKADAFMDFTWNVMDKVIHGQPINQQIDMTSVITQMTNMFQSELSIIKSDMQQLKYNVSRQQPTKRYSKWKNRTSPKLKMMADYFTTTQINILKNLYIELENTYDISLDDYQSDYCLNMGLDNCSMFDVIDSEKDLRKIFDCTIDDLLNKYKLCDTTVINKRQTIFDN